MSNAPRFVAWIEIGRTSALYTLHRKLVGLPEHPHAKIYTYVRNLGRTWETACKNADKWIDGNSNCEYIKDYDISDEMGTLRAPGKYDDDQLWFGKYKNEYITDVMQQDPEYLRFIRDNFTSDDPRIKCLIEKLEAMDLGKSKAQLEKEEREKRDAELEGTLKPIPTDLADGRHTFTGEVMGTRSEPDGFGGSSIKMLFLDDRGFKLWGTSPLALWLIPGEVRDWNGEKYTTEVYRDDIKGLRVQFDAAIEISNKDEKFGFIKRPTKAQVLEEAA